MAVGVAAEIKNKLSVVDVIGETVQLKKAGTTFKGLCPFHGEKTPSFTVTPGRDSWKCFGCGEGGDVFSFVMKRDGLSFPKPSRPSRPRPASSSTSGPTREDARKARLRDVMESAIAFYHAVLTGSKTGQPALDYLRGRGFTDETIKKHQLGYAPGGWDTLTRQLAAKRQIRPDDLVEVGLAQPRQSARGGVYDRFRERVIFPIRDMNGGPVGLGGRVLEVAAGDDRDHGPKYLNSPATPLFDKSRTLYLIDRAKASIRKSNQAVIVEGYTDALMAHQAGFENVVASLGTALTPGQVGLLTRYGKRIALAYDVDAAGEKAGTFGVSSLESIIRQLAAADTGRRARRGPRGPAAGRQGSRRGRPRQPRPLARGDPDRPADRRLPDRPARQGVRPQDPGGKTRFVNAIVPTLRVIPPVMRDAYLQTIHRVSGVEERTVLEVLHQRPDAVAVQGRITADAVIGAADALPVDRILEAITPVEEELLRLILLVPDQQLRAADEIGPDQLPSHARPRAVPRDRPPAGRKRPGRPSALLDVGADGRPRRRDPGRSPRRSSPGRRRTLVRISPERIAYAVDRCLLRLERLRLDERADWVAAELLAAEGRGDRETVDRLVDLQRQTNESRRAVDRQIEQATVLVAHGHDADCVRRARRLTRRSEATTVRSPGGTRPWLIPSISNSSKPF